VLQNRRRRLLPPWGTGARIEYADPPIWNLRSAYVTLCESAFAGVIAGMAPERMALLDPGLIETARRGMMTSTAVAREAELERVRSIQAFVAFFNEYDSLLTPCVPIAPFTAGHGINTPDPEKIPEWYDWTPYTWVFNTAKLPAASCP
jgi:aspartyl-tRNA(Asn)/glutamyl-tRNA(Gln) amidotransferase subunit A